MNKQAKDAMEHGIVPPGANPYSAAIRVKPVRGRASKGEWIAISQTGGLDEVLVSESQLQWFLLAITSVAKTLQWKEYMAISIVILLTACATASDRGDFCAHSRARGEISPRCYVIEEVTAVDATNPSVRGAFTLRKYYSRNPMTRGLQKIGLWPYKYEYVYPSRPCVTIGVTGEFLPKCAGVK